MIESPIKKGEPQLTFFDSTTKWLKSNWIDNSKVLQPRLYRHAHLYPFLHVQLGFDQT